MNVFTRTYVYKYVHTMFTNSIHIHMYSCVLKLLAYLQKQKHDVYPHMRPYIYIPIHEHVYD